LTLERIRPGYNARFFLAQADAMMRGRLDVQRVDIAGECWDRGGDCYGYFGVTPSLLRLPAIGVLHRLNSAMTPLFVAIAVLLAFWAALRLVGRGLLDAGVAIPDRLAMG